MIKKIKRSFINFHEWIFKRKELLKFKTQASLLEGEVEILEQVRKELTETVVLLTSGKSVDLTRNERRLLMNAITFPQFKEYVETPSTEAIIRITWKSLKEKIALSIVKEVDIAVKEDDETKAGDNG